MQLSEIKLNSVDCSIRENVLNQTSRVHGVLTFTKVAEERVQFGPIV